MAWPEIVAVIGCGEGFYEVYKRRKIK